jgi:hypothetical protein
MTIVSQEKSECYLHSRGGASVLFDIPALARTQIKGSDY